MSGYPSYLVSQRVYEEFTEPSDGRKYAITVRSGNVVIARGRASRGAELRREKRVDPYLPAIAVIMSENDKVTFKIEFGGGLELLFANQKQHTLTLPAVNTSGKPTDLTDTILWLRDNLLKERPELFVEDKTV
jgi:hypothetical protein